MNYACTLVPVCVCVRACVCLHACVRACFTSEGLPHLSNHVWMCCGQDKPLPFSHRLPGGNPSTNWTKHNHMLLFPHSRTQSSRLHRESHKDTNNSLGFYPFKKAKHCLIPRGRHTFVWSVFSALITTTRVDSDILLALLTEILVKMCFTLCLIKPVPAPAYSNCYQHQHIKDRAQQ